MSKLTSLNFASNRLTGTVPGNLGALQKLQYLDLSGNSFYGRIPASLCQFGRASPLVNLYLHNNNLTGSLNISNCGSLTLIDVSVSFGSLLNCLSSMTLLNPVDSLLVLAEQ